MEEKPYYGGKLLYSRSPPPGGGGYYIAGFGGGVEGASMGENLSTTPVQIETKSNSYYM